MKLAILCTAALAWISGCTVHHYHHNSPKHGKKMSKHHKAGHDALPAGHPPIKGHGMKNPHGEGHHGMKGHPPIKGHHGMKGHPPIKGHHGMKTPHGEGHHGKTLGGEGHHGMKTPHGKSHGAGHEEHHADQPKEILAFHDSFAAAWHQEAEEERWKAACVAVPEWKKLAQAIKKVPSNIVLAAAIKDLQQKTQAIGGACSRKTGDVQAALVSTHDALHMLFKVAPTK